MKRKLLAFFIIVLGVFILINCVTTGSRQSNHFEFPLKEIYRDHFLVGNIINGRYMTDEYMEILTAHFNVVTAENEMKPDALAPRERGGQYRWTGADRLVNAAIERGMKVHGHTLVWHNQTPAWMTEGTPAQVRQNLISHINTVMAHFKGRVFSWDVVNEAVLERINPGTNLEDWRNQLRGPAQSGWFRALGADYIELAFRTARAADPDVQLYYNDYNLNNQRKAQVVANMIRDINDRYRAEGNTRNLIDGVGLQAHYGLTVRVDDVRQTIERFIALGLKVDISELDIEISSVGSGSFGTGNDRQTTEVEQRTQALVYAQLFHLFMEYSEHIPRVTMWGLDDETSWKSRGNPCIFDGNLEPKQAFWAIVNPARTLRL